MMNCLIQLEASTLFFTTALLATGATDNDLRVAVGALTAAIATLFGIVISIYRTTAAKLNDCETDREKLWAKIAELEHK
jgi:hypothetical protein